MLVDHELYSYFASKYDKVNEIKRTAIEDESGETTVELYLKVFNLYLIPNTFFKTKNYLKQCRYILQEINQENTDDQIRQEEPESLPVIPIYISKAMTVKDLEKKIIRVLFNFNYNYIKNTKKLITKVRLWKS